MSEFWFDDRESSLTDEQYDQIEKCFLGAIDLMKQIDAKHWVRTGRHMEIDKLLAMGLVAYMGVVSEQRTMDQS